MIQIYNYGTGRRKSSIARVFMKIGTGKITVNKIPLSDYFKNKYCCYSIKKPLYVTENIKKFDFKINVQGGGFTGQSDAIKLGISRSLIEFDKTLKKILKKNKLTTRDSRSVERKKVGFKKSRKKRQFSKR